MINSVRLKSFGPIGELQVGSLQRVNLLIGRNGVGKSFLLKALYSAMKTVEQTQRGKEIRGSKEILLDKLHWTFQTSPIGNLVRKGDNMLEFEMHGDDGALSYSFGPSTSKQIVTMNNRFSPRSANSVYIPAKEVLSLQNIITDSRDRYAEFGFDDTYVDLARALLPTSKGKNYQAFADARHRLADEIQGKLEYDTEKGEWRFRDQHNRSYELSITSEGVKKIAIIDLLLGNRYLSNNSIVFIDEVEANLHPAWASRFLEIVISLAQAGVQFFLSTHSYLVVKKLYILAHREQMDIPAISFEETGISVSNLKEEFPDNSIIREAIRLYDEETNL